MADNIQISKRPGSRAGIEILSVKGPINHASSPVFQDAIASVTAPRLIVDLTEMPSVDSMAVGALVRAFVSCNKAGRKLVFVGMNHRVRNVLEITGVAPLFETYVTTPEAEGAV